MFLGQLNKELPLVFVLPIILRLLECNNSFSLFSFPPFTNVTRCGKFLLHQNFQTHRVSPDPQRIWRFIYSSLYHMAKTSNFFFCPRFSQVQIAFTQHFTSNSSVYYLIYYYIIVLLLLSCHNSQCSLSLFSSGRAIMVLFLESEVFSVSFTLLMKSHLPMYLFQFISVILPP